MADLDQALATVRARLLDPDTLVRAVAAGRRKGQQPRWRRVELRYVDLRGGRRLQVTALDATQAFTSNHDPAQAAAQVDALLAEPFGNWHVWTRDGQSTRELALRVTRKGEALTHERAAAATEQQHAHDRAKSRLLDPGDPVLHALGLTDDEGRVKPSRQAKLRQVEELLRLLDAGLTDATATGALPEPGSRPLRLVDLGCGNGYLTFAVHRYLTAVRGLPVEVLGVDTKAQAREHGTTLAQRLDVTDVTFVDAAIDDPALDLGDPDVVLALHACDTATDDALAQAVRRSVPLVLAAPCCHHDVAAQLRRRDPPAPYGLLTRDGILRERLADTLTDALRAAVLRSHGYRVDVVEFVESRHTPRNTLLRAVRTGAASPRAAADLHELVDQWRIRPRLLDLVGAG